MKLTVPYLGHIDIFLNAMARKIGPEFIFPPKTSSRTLLLSKMPWGQIFILDF